MNIYRVHWLNKGTIQAGGIFIFYLVIHAFVLHFILFVSLPFPVLAIPPFCAFGLITASIKFQLLSLKPDWCSFLVFSCIFMPIPWNIPVLFHLPFSRSIFLHNFHLNIFAILSNILPLGFLSLHSRFPCDFFLFISVCHLEFLSVSTFSFSYTHSIPHFI